MAEPLLSVEDLTVDFTTGAHVLRAVDRVRFAVEEREILGIVGESGSGKSTIASAVTGFVPAVAGDVRFEGRSLFNLSREERRTIRRDIQLVFQDPMASLNPRLTIGVAIAEGLRFLRPDLDAKTRMSRVRSALERVGLESAASARYPHEFSGGQRQRVSIARAIVLEPKLLICDESVSALDVSVQAQILNLLLDLRQDLGMAIIFISHDMAVVRQVCDRTLVLYFGRSVELGLTADIIARPTHPYTVKLMQSVPRISDHSALPEPTPAIPDLNPRGEPGCNYAALCPLVDGDCRASRPAVERVRPGQFSACLRAQAAEALLKSAG